MGWISAIGGFLFGGGTTSDKVLAGGMAGIDKIWYTDEEKADGKKAMFELYIEYQKATAPQNVARRLIALIVTALWATIVSAAGTLYLIGAEDEAGYLLTLLDDGGVSMAFIAIIGFYFAKRILGGLK